MKARSADLATLWEGICWKYEQQGERVPPKRWRAFHEIVARILRWGQR